MFTTVVSSGWPLWIDGHVSLSSIMGLMPLHVQRAAGQVVVCLAGVTVALLAWVSGGIAVQQWRVGTDDMWSVDLPGWLLYAFLAAGFGLMATEFLSRFIATFESLQGKTVFWMEGAACSDAQFGPKSDCGRVVWQLRTKTCQLRQVYPQVTAL